MAYQQDNGGVKKESNQCVGNESTDTETVDITHGETGSLNEESDDTVSHSAGRGVVVQRNQGIHLELCGAEQTLDHDKAECLEHDTGDLDEETDHLELDLAERSNDDTDNNERHVA